MIDPRVNNLGKLVGVVQASPVPLCWVPSQDLELFRRFHRYPS